RMDHNIRFESQKFLRESLNRQNRMRIENLAHLHWDDRWRLPAMKSDHVMFLDCEPGNDVFPDESCAADDEDTHPNSKSLIGADFVIPSEARNPGFCCHL